MKLPFLKHILEIYSRKHLTFMGCENLELGYPMS